MVSGVWKSFEYCSHEAGRTREDALRAGVAAGAASTLELGAGIFDPRQAARFQGGVTLTELAPLAV